MISITGLRTGLKAKDSREHRWCRWITISRINWNRFLVNTQRKYIKNPLITEAIWAIFTFLIELD